MAQSAEQAYPHNVHRDGEWYPKKREKISTRVFKHYARDAHTVQTDRSEGQCGNIQHCTVASKLIISVMCVW